MCISRVLGEFPLRPRIYPFRAVFIICSSLGRKKSYSAKHKKALRRKAIPLAAKAKKDMHLVVWFSLSDKGWQLISLNHNLNKKATPTVPLLQNHGENHTKGPSCVIYKLQGATQSQAVSQLELHFNQHPLVGTYQGYLVMGNVLTHQKALPVYIPGHSSSSHQAVLSGILYPSVIFLFSYGK